jgi:uncharacterized iron-regulated protein
MWWLIASALAGCETVDFATLATVDSPAVIVLGERHGHQPDLRRAERLVASLASRTDVTLALEAVTPAQQPILDKFESGLVASPDLPGLLNWVNTWGFDWKRYENLVTGKLLGAHVVGIGVDHGPLPEGTSVPIPPRYTDALRDGMGGHDMPPAMEADLASAMAWRDHRLAKGAVDAWDGRGFLVIVAGRAHVEGGKGVGWQAERLTPATVHTVTLFPGRDPMCTDDDLYWK